MRRRSRHRLLLSFFFPALRGLAREESLTVWFRQRRFSSFRVQWFAIRGKFRFSGAATTRSTKHAPPPANAADTGEAPIVQQSAPPLPPRRSIRPCSDTAFWWLVRWEVALVCRRPQPATVSSSWALLLFGYVVARLLP